MARAPMPAPQMIETPTMRRSAMLAKLLEEQRQPVEIKGGYGELAARLLGQGITQFSANRAERTVRTERKQLEAARRDALLGRLPSLDGETATPPPVSGPASVPAASPSALADALSPQPITNTQEPRFAATAPAAVIDGAPLPPPMPAERQTLEDVLLAGASPSVPPVAPAQPTTLDDALLSGPLPMPQGAAVAAAPMSAAPQVMPAAPQAMPAPPAPAQNPRGPTPQEIALIQQAAQSGDPGQLAWAEQTWGEIQMRMATPPEINIAIAPDGTPYNTNDPASLNQRFRSVEFVNGFAVNRNDPNVVGQYFPDLQPGEEPLYDQNGNVVGVRNLMGAIQALGERVGTEANARNQSEALFAGPIASAQAQAQAPFEFITVPGPNGQNVVIAKSQAVGGAFAGQTPVEAIEAQGEARNRVAAAETNRARASAAMRVLPPLDTMEQLLPDVITGFNADLELQTARATAGINPTARRRATATQTFQNEARQVVAGILPMFGTNPTEGERKYAEQMSGADVSYTPEALQDGINLARARAAREAVAANMPVPERLARYLPRGTVFIGEDNQRYRAP
jgi:hypothetical protein